MTILRSTPSLYESSFGYFKNEVKEYKNAPSLTEFYSNPNLFYILNNRNANSHFAHNHIAFDLGYSTEINNLTLIDEIAQEIDDLSESDDSDYEDMPFDKLINKLLQEFP